MNIHTANLLALVAGHCPPAAATHPRSPVTASSSTASTSPRILASQRRLCLLVWSLWTGGWGLAASPATANQTNVWPFSTAAQYTLSSSNDIEVADGAVKLLLLTKADFTASLSDYNAGTISYLQPGVDAGLGLVPTGSVYPASATYRSRIMGGGSGNIWQAAFARVGNILQSKNSPVAMTTNLIANTVALYHFDDDALRDEVSGKAGAYVGTSERSTDAYFGPYSRRFYGGGYGYLVNSNLLNGVSACTLSAWVYLDTYTSYARIMASEGGGGLGYFSVALNYRTTPSFAYGLRTKSDSRQGTFVGTTAVVDGQWYHVVLVFDRKTATVSAYVNGLLDGSLTSQIFYSGTLVQDRPIAVASSALSGKIDELAVFNRALSVEEVKRLYLLASSVKFQVRSGSTTNLTTTFVGPDGTPGTAFVSGLTRLPVCADFSPADRYVQYQATIGSSPARDDTSYIAAMGLVGTLQDGYDDMAGEFSVGTFSTGLASLPARTGSGFLGLSKRANGGYVASGVYKSRVFDAGSPVTWTQIRMKFSPEGIPVNAKGLLGLWPMDGSWVDTSGNGRTGAAGGGVSYDERAKIGRGSCRFDGVDSQVTVPTLTGLRALEWWMRPDVASAGVIQLNSSTSTPPARVTLTNGWLKVENWPGQVFVNGAQGRTHLDAGWNHVALVGNAGLGAVSMVVGAVDGATRYAGLMDDMAAYSRELTSSEVAAHTASGVRDAAGKVTLSVRAGGGISELEAKSFSGSYTDPTGSDLIGFDGRYFQYQATLEGDQTATPSVESVTAYYNLTQTIVDDTGDKFAQGAFVNDLTTWYGEDLGRRRVAPVGPLNARTRNDATWAGLWHLDETAWLPGLTVRDSSGKGRDGSPQGDAAVQEGARVGTACGIFDGGGDYVALQAIGEMLANDFSVALWFRTGMSTRAALISNYDADRYFTVEVNGDGGGSTQVGKVAFTINDRVSGPRTVVSSRGGLNDGVWHHVAAVRRKPYIYMYVDGSCVGATEIGTTYSLLGFSAPLLAKDGTRDIYFKGQLDEIAILLRPLSPGEIEEMAGLGGIVSEPGSFVSEALDAGRASIWRKITWGADGPHGTALTADSSMMGLWSMDEAGGVLQDATGGGHAGTGTGIDYAQAGVFSNAIGFIDSGDRVQVAHATDLEPPEISVETWVYASEIKGRTLVDKMNATGGYALFLDAEGKATFSIGGAAARDWLPLRPAEWCHVAGSYDGTYLRVYVNGDLRGATKVSELSTGSGAPLRFGQPNVGSGTLVGSLDQVAIHNRALSSEDIADRYRSHVGKIELQVRAGDTLPLIGNFIGPDGTPNTHFTQFAGGWLQDVLPLSRYLQFKATIESTSARYPAVLRGVKVEVSSYSTANPWVEPAKGYAASFVGHLTGFDHALRYQGAGTDVRYQLSGDNGTNWYRWNSGQSKWDLPEGFGYPSDMSDTTTINSHIGSFFQQLYSKTGGQFKFRAYLHSSGDDQIELDLVRMMASRGRVIVTSPNGLEVGNNAWLVDTTYPITWTSAGQVSNNLKIEYSINNGQSWSTIATGQANDGLYEAWRTPALTGNQMLVRITDASDSTIFDASDAPFQLTDRFQVTVPNGGETWYLTEGNIIKWTSPGPAAARGGQVDVRYSADGVNYDFAVARFAANTEGSRNNSYTWAMTPGQPPMPLPSKAGRIRVHAADNLDGQFNGQDESDLPFTLAGVTVLNPGAGAYLNNGQQVSLTWVSADAGPAVALDFSRDNGSSWTNVAPSLANSDGQNIYPWTVNLSPSDTARLRIRSLSNAKVWGLSAQFQLADIQLTAPVAAENWELRTTKTIRWESGGAGGNVDLFYSVDGGATWTGLASNVVNTTSNAYPWQVAPYPSATARIRVVSQIDPDNLVDTTPNFNIAGVRLAYPNGGEIWPKDVTGAIQWEFNQAGSEGSIYVTQDGGAVWTKLADRGLGNRFVSWKPTFPSARCLARIDAVAPPAWAVNMKDESDAYFTVGGISVTSPTNSQLFTIGDKGNISWTSAGAQESGGDGFARLYYVAGSVSNLIATLANNETPPGGNTYQWTTPSTLTPSLSARISVVSGPFSGQSPTFVLRGMRFKKPDNSSVIDLGSKTLVTWDHAGLDPLAEGFLFLSTDNGATFESAAINPAAVRVAATLYDWTVPSNAMPTGEAILKFQVKTSPAAKDVNYAVNSQPFVLRGLKIIDPRTGSAWAHGSSNTVHLVASRAGNFASVFFSADGVTYDMDRPIVRNLPLQDGHSYIPWRVESFRLPSATARLKAISTQATTISEPFTVEGVKVTRPYGTDVWAAGETNTITWTGVGTQGSYDVYVERPGGPSLKVASSYSGNSLAWLTSVAVVGTGVTVRVVDAGGYSGVSEPFRVVSEPAILITAPAADAFWRVTDTYPIVWSRGGAMPNSFSIYSSTAPYTSTQLVYTGSAAYDAANSTFSYPWTVPDQLGATRIIVVNNSIASIRDESPVFYVVGKFQIATPNGGEQNLFARKPFTVVWYTWGTVPYVNLYYSTDPLHADGTWVKINSAPVVNPGQGTEPSTYQWEVADLGGAIGNVRLRVEQADRPGAYDDSDADFSINYYTIVWDVVDEKTGQHLSNLSVTESSGVSASGLTAPVTRKYPYGRFDTVWSREYFYDNVLFNWLSEPSRTIQITMKRSDVDPDYSVRANFTYEGGVNDRLAIYAWIERGGTVQPDPTKCTVYVYDVDGNSVTNLISTTPQPTTGVFRYSWDQVTKTLTRGQTYYAKVEILYSGQPYSSVITYTLRLADTEGLHTAVVSISSNLTDLATAQAQFRGATTAALGTLLTNTASIATDVSALTTSLEERVISPLNVLTSAVVGVIAPAVTSTLAQVTALEAQVDERTARILTRDGVVALGSVNTILYKTRPGYGSGVLLSVTRPDGTTVLGGQSMREVVGGIYELEVTASWGLGSYIVTCTDPSGKARDSTPLRVVAKDLYNVPIMMTGMSNDLRRVESEILNMSATLSSVSNATVKLDEIIVKLAALTNLDTLASAIQGLDLSALTNVTAMTGKIDDILTGVQGVQTTIGALTNLDDIAAAVGKIDVSALTNLTALSGDVGSILTTVGRLQSSSSDVSNRLTQLDQAFRGVQWSALTNIQTRVGDIQTALGALTNLTDIADAIQSIDLSALTNIGAVATDIQALRTEVGGIRTDLGILTNIETRIGGVETALGALTNLDQIAAAIQGLDVSALTNVASLAGDLARVESGVSSLSNAMAKVDWNSLTNMPGIAGDVASLKTQLAGVDLASLTNIAGQVSALTNAIGNMNWDDVLGLVDTLSAVTGGVASIESYLTQLADVTTLARVGSTLSNAVGQVQSTVNSIDQQLAEVNTSSSQAASSSSEAASKSRSAKTEAGNASSGVQQLLSEIAEGNYSQVAETVASIQQALMEAKKNIDEIPKVVGPENYHEKMMSMASTIQELASSAGYVNLLNLPASELPAEGVEGADKESIGTLSRNLEEMKLSMQVMQKLMDEKLYEPVVESTLIGVE